ncbi:molybdopterin-binding protein [Clostridium lacusfryxellense]|uniref:molybdopterin-binding protein n=1 Tax=Clostridium lacusfryxellense TaxID=205328 RepID=UPI001C0CF200|nr:molybdopterin-binding protein [Clostridium lacusfryxellense]MBU3112460.1 molybdopterin-binding protein [Clostridium lacusfryxellense]
MMNVMLDDAVGMVIGHDLTEIIPGEFKRATFKKGHIIKVEDIEKLRNMGKNHINVINLTEDQVHEDEAALRLGNSAAGEGIYLEGPSQGRVNLKSAFRGLVKINIEAINKINSIQSIILSSVHNNTLVERDIIVAGTKAIPLIVENDKILEAENICRSLGKIISIKKIMPLKVGIIVTGTEVYNGRIVDKFAPILKEKIMEYGGQLFGIKYSPDIKENIKECIKSFLQCGAEVILISGGMSVDADDVTPSAIEEVADKVVTYGAPVLPGAMFMLSYKNEVAIIGIPACGMYDKITVFDLIFPRVLTREILEQKDFNALANGGLCLKCEVCRYPVCPFGKSSL